MVPANKKSDESGIFKFVPEKTLIPLSAISMIVVLIWSFFSVRALAQSAKSSSETNCSHIEQNTKDVREIEKQNAVIIEQLKNIREDIAKLDKRIP